MKSNELKNKLSPLGPAPQLVTQGNPKTLTPEVFYD
jgi:hypothetical protein